MGLDMYVFFTNATLPAKTDFPEPDAAAQLHYWRKHPNMHGWMQALYEQKGGKDPHFNLAPVTLELADLDRLEADLRGSRLPVTSGFFFGRSDGGELEQEKDLEFVTKARAAIKMGLAVYYVAWW